MQNTFESTHKVIVTPSCRSLIISNLHEAACSIETLIMELENEKLYSLGRFKVEIGHIYHHINFAWNIRGLRDISLYEKCHMRILKNGLNILLSHFIGRTNSFRASNSLDAEFS